MSISERTELIIGKEGVEKLRRSKVLIFGVGGVGGQVCEALGRAGIGEIHIVDNDIVSESNINRQIIASYNTIGMAKVKVMKERLLSINPRCIVKEYEIFYDPSAREKDEFDFAYYDYVVDAIDFVKGKISIIERSKAAGTPVISSMGTGNKLDPSKFQICDISKTKVCPLARVIRKELRDRDIKDVKVLYSDEEPIKTGSKIPGSISFVPPAAGLLIAGEVIRNILK